MSTMEICSPLSRHLLHCSSVSLKGIQQVLGFDPTIRQSECGWTTLLLLMDPRTHPHRMARWEVLLTMENIRP